MGDIEDVNEHEAEAWLIAQHYAGEINLDADVLVPAHHGSNNATKPAFLETAQPEWALISADSTDHPATETLQNLQAYDPEGVYVTGDHGRTTFTGELPPTPTQPNASTEPWAIDQQRHGSLWSDLVGQERERIEELEAKNTNLEEENKEKDDRIEEQQRTIEDQQETIDAFIEDRKEKRETIKQLEGKMKELIEEREELEQKVEERTEEQARPTNERGFPR